MTKVKDRLVSLTDTKNLNPKKDQIEVTRLTKVKVRLVSLTDTRNLNLKKDQIESQDFSKCRRCTD